MTLIVIIPPIAVKATQPTTRPKEINMEGLVLLALFVLMFVWMGRVHHKATLRAQEAQAQPTPPAQPPKPKRKLRKVDPHNIPSTWTGEAISDDYKRQIIEEDEEIPF